MLIRMKKRLDEFLKKRPHSSLKNPNNENKSYIYFVPNNC